MRRTLGLLALVGLGVVLALAVHGPPPPAPRAPHGIGLLGVGRGAVRGVDVELNGRRFAARRVPAGWEIDGRPASAATASALDDLVGTLAHLRPVDRFRGGRQGAFGLDHPHATIAVTTVRRTRRLLLGETNAAGSAVYARRDHDRRVLQVGTGLLSTLERVFYCRDLPPRPDS